MSFLETPRFPDDISYGSKGGPMYNTTVITVDSGWEQRNINWAYPKSHFDVSFGVRKRQQLYDLVKHFRSVKGSGHGFRYKDWTDFKSHHGDQLLDAISDTDQVIGTGDGTTNDFQLIKNYDTGILVDTRIIQKPVVGTVTIALDGVPLVSGWTVGSTGIVNITPAPGVGVVVTAGFEFDVPVRFDSDFLETNYEFYEGGSASTTVLEIRV